MHVAHFLPDVPHRPERPVRRPKSPVVSHTRFDAWSSRGGRLERTQGEHPHVLGLCDVCWKGVAPRTLPAPKFSFFRILPIVSVVLYRDSPIDHSSKDGQNSKKLNFLISVR